MTGHAALVAVSGGRDSALALHLSLEEGRRTRAACVDMGRGIPEAARRIAQDAGVDLLEVDGRQLFAEEVLARSRRMLQNGLTPNPCAMCNRGPKLGLLFDELRPEEALVTGHYAFAGPDGLLRGRDREKDQSYFLSLVPEKVLERCHLPLGGWTKAEVTAEVRRLGLPCQPRESMDLCFDPLEGADKLRWTILDSDGEFLVRDRQGPVPTVGQRLRLPGMSRRLYAVSVDFESRTIAAGTRDGLQAEGCVVGAVNDLGLPKTPTFAASIQIRYRKAPVPCSVSRRSEELVVRFDSPAESVAPGQVAAIGRGGQVLAGGIIGAALKGDQFD